MNKVALWLPLAFVAACAAPPAAGISYFQTAVPLCAVVNNPADYVGREIAVRGLLFVNPHGATFIDPGCERGELLLLERNYQKDDPMAVRVLRGAQRREPLASVPVVFAGILTDQDGPNGARALVCRSGSLCSRYSFNKSKLIAAGEH